MDAIKRASFLSEKRELAVRLGRLRTPAARQALMELLEDKSYWNRGAAVAGLFELADAGVGKILAERMLEDHMIDSEIEKGFQTHMQLYYRTLVELYEAPIVKSKRERLLKLICSSKAPPGEQFVKGVIEDAGSENRELAFQCLVENYPKNNYGYVKKRAEDALFRKHALAYLYVNGERAELPLFLEIIRGKSKDNEKERIAHLLVAYKAVNKWGDSALKETIFLEGLQNKNEMAAQSALLVFKKTQSPAITGELFRLVKQGEYQQTRMLAALRLADVRSKAVVPYLILALNERFQPAERGAIDYIAGVLTLGISAILSDIHQRSRQGSFNARKTRIAKALASITGAANGTSYRAWRDWAVYNGYTVNGRNIIQYLFSGYPAVRARALDAAAGLLGYRTLAEFKKKHPDVAGDNARLSLLLAQLLLKEGYQADEKYPGR